MARVMEGKVRLPMEWDPWRSGLVAKSGVRVEAEEETRNEKKEGERLLHEQGNSSRVRPLQKSGCAGG